MAECCLAIQVIDSKRYATKLLIIRCLWMSRSSDSKFSRLANLNRILEERRQRIHLPAVQAARRIEGKRLERRRYQNRGGNGRKSRNLRLAERRGRMDTPNRHGGERLRGVQATAPAAIHSNIESAQTQP